jgi:hypothetical protein
MADTLTPEPQVQETVSQAPDPKVKETELEERIRKIAQSEADRVRTEYSHKLKAVQEENELLKKEKMSAADRAKYEAQQRDELLSKREKELFDRENTILATNELANAGLDISFVEFVKGGTPEQTKANVAALRIKFTDALSKAIDEKMKGSAREPPKGHADAGTSDFMGMTAKQIEIKGKKDAVWWAKNEAAILQAAGDGKIKKE